MFGVRQSHIRRTPRPSPSFAGLRRHDRRDFAFEVLLQDEDGWEIPFDGINLSPTGVFVASDYLFEIGDEHTLVLTLPEREMYRLKARVVRVVGAEREDAGSATGMGYEFVETSEATWCDLCDVVARG